MISRGDTETETRRSRDVETRRRKNRDVETWGHTEVETGQQRDTERGSGLRLSWQEWAGWGSGPHQPGRRGRDQVPVGARTRTEAGDRDGEVVAETVRRQRRVQETAGGAWEQGPERRSHGSSL